MLGGSFANSINFPSTLCIIKSSKDSPSKFRGSPTGHGTRYNATPNVRFQLRGRTPFRANAPRSEPGPRGNVAYRGAPGFFGTPNLRNSNNFEHRGRHNSNRNSWRRAFSRASHNISSDRGKGNQQKRFGWSETGYFHPSMLEDPWAHLQMSDISISNCDSSNITTSSKENPLAMTMSDSMIAQVS